MKFKKWNLSKTHISETFYFFLFLNPSTFSHPPSPPPLALRDYFMKINLDKISPRQYEVATGSVTLMTLIRNRILYFVQTGEPYLDESGTDSCRAKETEKRETTLSFLHPRSWRPHSSKQGSQTGDPFPPCYKIPEPRSLLSHDSFPVPQESTEQKRITQTKKRNQLQRETANMDDSNPAQNLPIPDASLLAQAAAEFASYPGNHISTIVSFPYHTSINLFSSLHVLFLGFWIYYFLLSDDTTPSFSFSLIYFYRNANGRLCQGIPWSISSFRHF